MVDKNNRTETRYANGIDYIYEFLSDGWIAIWKFIDGLPWIPVIQAMNVEKADAYIHLTESVNFPLKRLV